MTYIVLHNKNATVFADTGSGVTVTSHTVPVKVTKITKRIAEGIKGGAIREVPEDEALAAIEKAEKAKTDAATSDKKKAGKGGKGKEETLADKLTKMKPEERLAYYKENYEVSAEDEKTFLAMKAEEQVAFLQE
jgi:hypothetical protein